MKNLSPNFQIAAGKRLSRFEIIAVLQKALQSKSYRFSRELASHWLSEYPGDIQIETLHAQALIQDQRADLAVPILKQITNTDPEYIPAQRLLAFASESIPFNTKKTAQASVYALGGKGIPKEDLPDWAFELSKARKNIQSKNHLEGAKNLQSIFHLEVDTPLVAVMHLQTLAKNKEWQVLQNTVERYIKRWPDCLVITLIYADLLMQAGREDEAVAYLHHAASLDITGQVATRLWGADHPYQMLWQDSFAITIPFPIPADVVSALGWNQLGQGEGGDDPSGEDHSGEYASHSLTEESNPPAINDHQEETPVSIFKKEIERIAEKIKRPEFSFSDGRFPTYVILTTHMGLSKHYGAENLARINQSLKELVNSTRKVQGWNACLYYADDPNYTDQFDIPLANPIDPWSIKNSINDLDKALKKRGEMIGALLIVGGPEVVPYHMLPNPIDDMDMEVPSDNPYGAPDENYFIASWPVGRLPGSKNGSTDILLDQIQVILDHRKNITQPKSISFWKKLFASMRNRFSKSNPSFGLTAQVWRRASNAVFRPIGKPHTLVISPPTEAEEVDHFQTKTTKLAYFNLHGLQDAPEWYGQRDPIESPSGPDYPVALRPQDIVNSGKAPEIVFSEACYGANVINKNVEDAISLKFLASGSLAMVGSTCTSYGSIGSPLIAADLLGKIFWNNLVEGYPAGEALRRSKISLIREMHKRQGYLDGEDQKTLISFHLLGDPLAQPYLNGKQSKSIIRPIENTANIKTVCDKANSDTPALDEIPREVISQVKGFVEDYLPGMKGSKVNFSQEHIHCEGHNCPTHHLGEKANPKSSPKRQVFTLSKTLESGNLKHHKFARITVDENGEVVKVAVSR